MGKNIGRLHAGLVVDSVLMQPIALRNMIDYLEEPEELEEEDVPFDEGTESGAIGNIC